MQNLVHADYPNACLNRFLKASTESVNLRSAGRAFHSLGATASKARSPRVFRRVCGRERVMMMSGREGDQP